MSRAEFSKATKRQALRRSEGRCEAIGQWYGLPEERRCDAKLSHGVEFDHVIQAANGGRSDLDNCNAVCPACHRWKTSNRDTPAAAKTVRMQDKYLGVRKSKRGFRAWRKFNGEIVFRD